MADMVKKVKVFLIKLYGKEGKMETRKKGSHLNIEERRQIAILDKEGWSPYKIAKKLKRASNTIRNELKRGTVKQVVGYQELEIYFPDTGDIVYKKHRKGCGRKKKLNSCAAFLHYVEEKVKKGKRSFAAARAEALETGAFKQEEVVSVDTLYSYAENGEIEVKNIDLPEKVKRKQKRKTYCRKHKRLTGKSIEKRPEIINEKTEFGHWEIDCVIGKKTSDKVLLTLTERMTRKEIIRKMPKKNVNSVHKVLNQLKREVPNFSLIFKSITTDNGSEFAKLHRWGKRAGVSVFYAHPYSSWERGLNENTNRIIRRFIQKGTEIKAQSKKRIQWIENWINTMYRKSIGWKTADQRYEEEVERILKSRKIECV